MGFVCVAAISNRQGWYEFRLFKQPLSEEENTAAIQTFYQQNKLTTPEAITAELKQLCITQTQLEKLATKELKLEKFKQVTWGNKLEQYFLQVKPPLRSQVSG